MRNLMNMVRNFVYGREHKVILSFTLGIAFLMFLIQFLIDGELDGDFWESLIPNVIIDMLGILITSYIISYLFLSSQEIKAKEKVHRMLGKRYEEMVMNLARDYITFLSKKPATVEKDIFNMESIIPQIKEINSNINNYIKEDFLKKGVSIIEFDNSIRSNSTLGKIRKKELTVQQYTYYFKKKNLSELDAFISKYLSVLPDDLRESIFRIEDLLKSGIFSTGIEVGIVLDTSEAKFDVKDFSNVFLNLGEEILFLLTYFRGRESVDTTKN
ncbi:hypothetical protein U5N28_12130, partial [Lysinibacillus telephonicus]|uniref:hypothetical protein n=1 Tax=Lysinibacillus telephonicus TaxID=1714840 RepID=UPI003978158A